jgi:LPS-assembly lipoprotein
LQELKLDKRAAGVGSDALVNAYELILFVDYQISSPDKILTTPNTRGSISRTYDFEVNQANFSEQQETLILREMHRDLAQQLLRRLKVLSNKTATSP